MADKWASEYGDFRVDQQDNLIVMIDRAEFIIATNKDLEYLKTLTEIYTKQMDKMVDELGFDTVDMVIFPENKTIRLLNEDFSLRKEIPFYLVEKKA